MSLNVVDTHKHSDLYKFEKYIVSKFNDHQIQLDTIANSSTATNAFANIINDINQLPSSAQVGAVYVVNDGTVGHLYYWNGTNWIQLSGTGSSSGGSGGGTITNVVNNITNISQVPAGATKGDVSVINGSMYYWDGTQWLPVSSNTVNNYTTINQLPTTGNTTGSVSMVNGSLYYWDGNDWKPVNSSGSITYNNTYTTVNQLPTTGVSTGTVSMVGDSLYYWDGSKWEPVSTTTINNYTSTTNLPQTGNTDGSVSMVNGSLYYWDATANTWKPISSSGGTTIINYNSTADLPNSTNTATGTVSMVNGSLYYWNGTAWTPINTNSINNYTTTSALPSTGNTKGTVAMVDGSLYYWDGTDWKPVISNGGTTVINNYNTTSNLPNTASTGSVSMVDGVLYYWDTSTNSWKPVANGNVINNVYNNANQLPQQGDYQGQVAVAGNTLYYWNGSGWQSIGGGLTTGTLTATDPYTSPNATVNGSSLDLTFPLYPKYGYMYHSENQSISIAKNSAYHSTLHKLSFLNKIIDTFPTTNSGLTVSNNSEFTISNGVYQISYYVIYDAPSDLTADDLVIDFRVSADTSISIDTASVFHDVSAFTQMIDGTNKAIFIANRTIPAYNTSFKFAFYLTPDSNGNSSTVSKDISLTNGKHTLYITQVY
jgi:hypothetical protein